MSEAAAERSARNDGTERIKKDLAASFADALLRSNLTEAEAARICGTDRPTLSGVLSGRLAKVSMDTLVSWLSALDCPVEVRCRPPAPREIDERNRIALEAMGGGILDLDLTTGAGACSDELRDLFGLAAGVPPSPAILEPLFAPADWTRLCRAFETACRAGGAGRFQVDLSFRRADDDSPRRITGYGKVLFDETSRAPARLVAVVVEAASQPPVGNEEEFRALADSLPQQVWIMRPDGTATFLNRRFREYHGFEMGPELQERMSTIHPDDREAALRIRSAALSEGRPFQVDVRTRRHDGIYRWHRMWVAPLGRGTGSRAWLGTATDIDDMRRTEEALRASEEKLRLAVDATKLGLWDLEIATGKLVWSDRLKAIYGIAPDATVDFETYARALHPEDRDRVISTYSDSLDPNRDGRFAFEHRLVRQDGSVRWVFGAGQVLFEEKRPVRAIGTAQDITDRKAGEEALRESEERFRLATEAFQGGVSDHDPMTGHVERTKRHLEIVGEPPGALPPTARAWYDRIHPDDLPAYDAARDPVFKGRASHYEAEYRVRHRDGGWVWVWHRAMAQRDESGRLRRVIGSLIDITRRKQAQEQQRLLIHELNHRVKNTLAIVQSIAAQTRSSARSLDAFGEAFEARLMALSRAHDLLTRSNWKGAALGDIVSAVLAPYAADPSRATIHGEPVELAPKAALALGLAFHELATNAAKYGALRVPSGRVDVAWAVGALECGRRKLHLEWRESGGPPVGVPTRRGFGSRLVARSVANELAGEIRFNFDPKGLFCALDIPLDPTEPSLHT